MKKLIVSFVILLFVSIFFSTYLFSASKKMPSKFHIIHSLNVAGKWKTTFGEVELFQNGSIITGTYSNGRGRLVGELRGNVLMGSWSEAPTYKPPNHAGDFMFIFSKDGKSFSGHWRWNFRKKWHDAKWDGEWKGTRISSINSGNTNLNNNYHNNNDYNPHSNSNNSTTTATNSYHCNNNNRYPNRNNSNNTRSNSHHSTNSQNSSSLNVAGKWKTTFGEVELFQNGSIITGTYSNNKARLLGELRGNVLMGSWSEVPTYKPPNHAGDFMFIFSKDGKSFSGHWRWNFRKKWHDAKWDGEWKGTRISP